MPYQGSFKSRGLGCGAMLLVFVIAPAVYFAGGAYTEALPRRFNSQSWIAVRDHVDKRRCGMLADLRLRVGIVGKNRRELTSVLGQPDKEFDDHSSSYWLLCPSYLDYWVLRVRWENDRAIDAIVHDT